MHVVAEQKNSTKCWGTRPERILYLAAFSPATHKIVCGAERKPDNH